MTKMTKQEGLSKVTVEDLKRRLERIEDLRKALRTGALTPFRSALRLKGEAAAAGIMLVPVEAAGAGFDVRLVKHETSWFVSISKNIDVDVDFRAIGRGENLLVAIAQMLDAAVKAVLEMKKTATDQLLLMQSSSADLPIVA